LVFKISFFITYLYKKPILIFHHVFQFFFKQKIRILINLLKGRADVYGPKVCLVAFALCPKSWDWLMKKIWYRKNVHKRTRLAHPTKLQLHLFQIPKIDRFVNIFPFLKTACIIRSKSPIKWQQYQYGLNACCSIHTLPNEYFFPSYKI